MTIVDSDEAVTRRASEQYGLVALSGDATIAAVLEEADVAQSDVVVAMLRREVVGVAAEHRHHHLALRDVGVVEHRRVGRVARERDQAVLLGGAARRPPRRGRRWSPRGPGA